MNFKTFTNFKDVESFMNLRNRKTNFRKLKVLYKKSVPCQIIVSYKINVFHTKNIFLYKR